MRLLCAVAMAAILSGCLTISPGELAEQEQRLEFQPDLWYRFQWTNMSAPMEFDLFGAPAYITRWYHDDGVQEHVWSTQGEWQVTPGRQDTVEVVIGVGPKGVDFSRLLIRHPGVHEGSSPREWPLLETGGFADGGFVLLNKDQGIKTDNVRAGSDGIGIGGPASVGSWSWWVEYDVPAGAYVASHTHHVENTQYQDVSYWVNDEEQEAMSGLSSDGHWPDGTIHRWVTTSEERHRWEGTGTGILEGGIQTVAPSPGVPYVYVAMAWFNGLAAPSGAVTTY